MLFNTRYEMFRLLDGIISKMPASYINKKYNEVMIGIKSSSVEFTDTDIVYTFEYVDAYMSDNKITFTISYKCMNKLVSDSKKRRIIDFSSEHIDDEDSVWEIIVI